MINLFEAILGWFKGSKKIVDIELEKRRGYRAKGYLIQQYQLDVILGVGYRTNSKLYRRNFSKKRLPITFSQLTNQTQVTIIPQSINNLT